MSTQNTTYRSLAEGCQAYLAAIGVEAAEAPPEAAETAPPPSPEPIAEPPALPDGDASGPLAQADPAPDEPTEAPAAEGPPDQADVAAEVASLDEEVAALRRRVEAERERASLLLEQHDALVAAQLEAEAARDRARAARAEAEALAATPFAGDEAPALAERAAAAAERAERLAELRRAAVAAFVAEHEVGPLLAERERRAEAERLEAARKAAADRLTQAKAAARKLAAASRFEEALALLGTATNENPGDAELRSLQESIARDLAARKQAEVADALELAWLDVRVDPGAAIERLTGLDPAHVPQSLAGQLFGCWSRACKRLCEREQRLEPRRHAPVLGRGVVVARERPDGPYVVVSALGMPGTWRRGEPVDPRVVERARPLR